MHHVVNIVWSGTHTGSSALVKGAIFLNGHYFGTVLYSFRKGKKSSLKRLKVL